MCCFRLVPDLIIIIITNLTLLLHINKRMLNSPFVLNSVVQISQIYLSENVRILKRSPQYEQACVS